MREERLLSVDGFRTRERGEAKGRAIEHAFFRYPNARNRKCRSRIGQRNGAKDALRGGCADVDAHAQQTFLTHGSFPPFSATPSVLFILYGNALLVNHFSTVVRGPQDLEYLVISGLTSKYHPCYNNNMLFDVRT